MERYHCCDMNDVRNNYGAIKVINDIYNKEKMKKPKDLLDAYKRGIRDYFKRKDAELERRIIHADCDEYIELLQLPEKVKTLEIAKIWFDTNELRVCRPSMYDCTGQRFTGGTTFVERQMVGIPHGLYRCLKKGNNYERIKNRIGKRSW